ncbi:hypothetical protein Pcinc_041531 [Petrolisthes cinctipes]|uniref:Uncharacterized protein n=1 Tax=Petrolisthes cinctipes TaxID=88211 RepID=A0AAE1BJE1_PETCI|nr:hypothetical protein Pcinc_041531 [Petrolisthes cinctipes]
MTRLVFKANILAPGLDDIHNTTHTTTVKMARFLLVTLVAVLGWQEVSGQGDRTPVNFPVGGSGSVVRGPVAFGPPGPPLGGCYGGFSVRKARTGFGDTVSANTKIQFRDVLLNMGGWSPSFNDFEAPCPGSYYFSFHAVSSQSGDFTLQLYKNGQYQVTAYGSSRDFQQASNSAILFLQQGDLVHLQLEQGTIYEHPGNEAYTSFSGYLVETDHRKQEYSTLLCQGTIIVSSRQHQGRNIMAGGVSTLPVVHIRIVQSSRSKVHSCDYCFQSFEEEASLMQHIAVTHSTQEVVQLVCLCPLCHTCLLCHLDLLLHLQQHHQVTVAVKEESRLCEYCGLMFSREASLLTHITFRHGQVFVQSYMEFSFKDLAGMGMGQHGTNTFLQVMDVTLTTNTDGSTSTLTSKPTDDGTIDLTRNLTLGCTINSTKYQTYGSTNTSKPADCNTNSLTSKLTGGSTDTLTIMAIDGKKSRDDATNILIDGPTNRTAYAMTEKANISNLYVLENTQIDDRCSTLIDEAVDGCTSTLRNDVIDCNILPWQELGNTKKINAGISNKAGLLIPVKSNREIPCTGSVNFKMITPFEKNVKGPDASRNVLCPETLMKVGIDISTMKDMEITLTETLSNFDQDKLKYGAQAHKLLPDSESKLQTEKKSENINTALVIRECAVKSKPITREKIINESNLSDIRVSVFKEVMGTEEEETSVEMIVYDDEDSVREAVLTIENVEMEEETLWIEDMPSRTVFCSDKTQMEKKKRVNINTGFMDVSDYEKVMNIVKQKEVKFGVVEHGDVENNKVEYSDMENCVIEHTKRENNEMVQTEVKNDEMQQTEVEKNMLEQTDMFVRVASKSIKWLKNCDDKLKDKEQIQQSLSKQDCQPISEQRYQCITEHNDGSVAEQTQQSEEGHKYEILPKQTQQFTGMEVIDMSINKYDRPDDSEVEGIIVISHREANTSDDIFSPEVVICGTPQRPHVSSKGQVKAKSTDAPGIQLMSEAQDHRGSVHGVGGVECGECHATFFSHHTLATHVKRKHSQGAGFECKDCGKAFRSQGNLWAHSLTHLRYTQRRFPCPQCSQRFPTKSKLTVHLQTHDGQKRFQCGECNKSFVYQSLLMHHMKKHIPHTHSHLLGEENSVYVVMEEKTPSE